MSIFYDIIRESELEDAYKIESEGYPEDEAASLEAFRYRHAQASELFLGAYLPSDTGKDRQLIGFVCATLSPDDTLTHASMATHIPGGRSVCIHSVCVASEQRRSGVGLSLVKEYVSRLASTGKYDRVLLIAHDHLREFYERAGFEWIGPSAVVHGARPWFEMRKDLTPASDITQTSTPETTLAKSPSNDNEQDINAIPQAPTNSNLPPGVWEALLSSSSRSRPAARVLSAFPNAVQDVVDPDPATGAAANKHDLLCPRPGCGSVILKAGVARWVERASVQLDYLSQSPSSEDTKLPEYLGALPAPPATAQWWLVVPNAMVFENIGFSRAVQGSEGGARMKFLACAECDLGPLGWCEEGGSEFWLACNRVGYRV